MVMQKIYQLTWKRNLSCSRMNERSSLNYTKWSVDKAGSYSMGEVATDVGLNLYLVARRHLLPKTADLQVHNT